MKPESLVATFAAGRDGILTAEFARNVMEQTGGCDLTWLAVDKACDIFFDNQAQAELQIQLRTFAEPYRCDVIVQRVENRAKKLLVADMESTIIEQEMLDELAHMVGVGPHVAAITRRAMNGELDFVAALNERAGLLKDLPAILLEHAAKKMTLMPGAHELVATMKKHGAVTLLVSGGFTCFVDKIVAQLGFDGAFANQLLIENDLITGRVSVPVLDRARKKALLQEVCTTRGLIFADTVSVGDGANDVPMLTASYDGDGLGIAYHAKPAVKESVPQQINFGDLRTILFAQGYREQDFVQD